MADKKISALTGATTPLDGTEVLPIVQSGATVKVANNDLRPKQIQSNATSGVLQVAGPASASTRVATVPDANFTVARTDAAQSFTGDQTLSTGNLVIGTSGNGIDFSATSHPAGMTSELLDDYEVGTWTPSLTIGGGSVTYTTQTGSYVKVGKLVTVQIEIVLASVSTPSSYIVIGSPPFTMAGGFGAGAIAVDGMEVSNVNSWECITRPVYNHFIIGAYIAGSLNNSGTYLKAGSLIAITASYQV